MWEVLLDNGILSMNRANFNENPSMRAIAKIFCEHEQASTRLNFASKSSKGQILRADENFYDHSIPLLVLFVNRKTEQKHKDSTIYQKRIFCCCCYQLN